MGIDGARERAGAEARVLVVDDEESIVQLLCTALRYEGFATESAASGREALSAAAAFRPDLVLLDVMLPDVSGLEVCRRVRRDEATAQLPILMLTAKGEEMDRVVGFEVGADDYVSKPFSPRELVLRIEAILRRGQRETQAPKSIVIKELEIDVPGHRVTVNGTEVVLTALEFRLLLDLATRRGRVQSRDALLQRVWGYTPGVETRTVDTHVKRLREKLGAASGVIETVRGVGYRIRTDD